MRHGYSPAPRHIKRKHGVCLRWLAERFRDPQYKAFTVPAEWDKVSKLINVLEPQRFGIGMNTRENPMCHVKWDQCTKAE